MPEAVPSHTACGHRDCGKSSPYLFLRFLLPALLVSPPILAGEPSPSIPKGNLRQPVPVTSDGRPLSAEGLLQPTADSVSRPIGRLVSGSTFKSWFRKPSNKLPPFALRCGFWLTTAPVDQATVHPGFTLQTVTSFHRPGLHHYYGFICHLTPRRSTSGCPLCLSYPTPDHSGIETMQGFPSYLGLPVNYPILNHATGLTRYWALRYLARLPPRYAESGSLTLCAVHFLSLPSDPAVTSNALAIRIDFPLVGATPVSFNRPGLPATLGKLENGDTQFVCPRHLNLLANASPHGLRRTTSKNQRSL
jgi:hypothetical protein